MACRPLDEHPKGLTMHSIRGPCSECMSNRGLEASNKSEDMYHLLQIV